MPNYNDFELDVQKIKVDIEVTSRASEGDTKPEHPPFTYTWLC